MTTEMALEPISLARRALAEATTLPAMKSVRATAAALLEWAKKRNLGIEAENPCAEIIVRAERKLGAELIRMVKAGERAPKQGSNRATSGSFGDRGLPTLPELGIEHNNAHDWQELATIPDDEWERFIVELLARPNERLSRANLVRAYFGPPKKVKRDPLRGDEDEWTAGWDQMGEGDALLGKALDQGWPLQSDRTYRGWCEVNDQITARGRNLLLFQKRVQAHMAALNVRPAADKETENA